MTPHGGPLDEKYFKDCGIGCLWIIAAMFVFACIAAAIDHFF